MGKRSTRKIEQIRSRHRPININELINYYGIGWFTIKLMALLGCISLANGALLNSLISVLAVEWTCEDHRTNSNPVMIWLVLSSGLAVGSLYYGWIGDRYGRKFALVLTTTISFYFTILLCFTMVEWEGVLMLFFVGTGLCSSRIMSNYAAETFPDKHRSRLQVYLGICSSLGSILATLLAYVHYFTWRHYTLILCIPFITFLLLPLWFPESIPYLQITGNQEELHTIFKHLSENHKKPLVRRTWLVTRVVKNRGQISALFQSGSLRNTAIMLLLWTTSRFAISASTVLQFNVFLVGKDTECPGNNINIMKQITFKEIIKCSEGRYLFSSFLAGSISEFVGLVFTSAVINVVSRRGWFLISFIATSVLLITLNFCMPRTLHLLLALTTKAVSVSVSQVLSIYTNEVYPTYIRSSVTGFLNFVSLIALILIPISISLVSVMTPIAMTIIYVLCSIGCCVSIPFLKMVKVEKKDLF